MADIIAKEKEEYSKRMQLYEESLNCIKAKLLKIKETSSVANTEVASSETGDLNFENIFTNSSGSHKRMVSECPQPASSIRIEGNQKRYPCTVRDSDYDKRPSIRALEKRAAEAGIGDTDKKIEVGNRSEACETCILF